MKLFTLGFRPLWEEPASGEGPAEDPAPAAPPDWLLEDGGRGLFASGVRGRDSLALTARS